MEHLPEALLMMVPGIGSLKQRKLVEHFGDAYAAWTAKGTELAQSRILNEKEISGLLSLRESLDPSQLEKKWSRQGIGICGIDDPDYPALLRKIFDPPSLLFYRGHMIGDSLNLAVVGSRRSTPYGRNVARSFSEKFACCGVSIVSGAARGIDTASHEGALAAGAGTMAILGCGVDIAYPPENASLLERIAGNGCLISEYPPGTPPLPGQFPARNRIIAGMSVGVLVVEAAEKSGALITADFALNENREVYAIPGSVFSNASRGVHRLIQQGARLIGSAEDLLEDLACRRRYQVNSNHYHR
jgi:DNA processing protein